MRLPLIDNVMRALDGAGPGARAALIVGLTLLTAASSVGSSLFFKLSAIGAADRRFLLYQVAGNAAGIVGWLAYTALLRLVPLHLGYPVTVGLAAIGVQVLAARLVLRESLGAAQWLGTALIVAGIALVASRRG